MTMAREQLVDLSVTRWYHCVARCVRRADLLSEGPLDRKEWIERRLEELAGIFAVSVGGFAVLDNQLQLLLRLDPGVVKSWSDTEVVTRWGRLCPPRDKRRQILPVSRGWVQEHRSDAEWMAIARERLQSLSWFMKWLKEPLSRLANRQDKTRGAFFEERFKSVAILDEESLLATCTYIDLNAAAAGVARKPGSRPHTSIRARTEHLKARSRAGDVKAAEQGSAAALARLAALAETGWLCPVEDRRGLGSKREGMLEGISLVGYLLLVESTGRSIREGKAAISALPSKVLEGLGISVEAWLALQEKLRKGRLMGRFSAASRERLRSVAAQLGVHHLANVGGMPDKIKS
jgi:hypothetical protein